MAVQHELTSLPQGVFSNLTNLISLTLYGNNLTELPAGLFVGLSSLNTVDCPQCWSAFPLACDVAQGRQWPDARLYGAWSPRSVEHSATGQRRQPVRRQCDLCGWADQQRVGHCFPRQCRLNPAIEIVTLPSLPGNFLWAHLTKALQPPCRRLASATAPSKCATP